MVNLTRASRELFRRSPDERFASLPELLNHCIRQRDESLDSWQPPQKLVPTPIDEQLRLSVGSDGAFALNDWSFSQLCRMAGVAKDTLNRLTAETASSVLVETLPGGRKPLQVLRSNETIRSVHGTAYTRLWNADIVAMLSDFATDFGPPPRAFDGSTGLYAGEQDLFCFLIDPAGWAEIDGEAFAPGFFVWNSEVGRRSVGISTFWFQQICQNHIVWDATEVVEFTRKHTASVQQGLGEIRRIVEELVARREARKDGFASVIRSAMETKLGDTSEEVETTLSKHGIGRLLAKQAVELTQQQKSRFTLWTLVDALTRLARELPNAGDRSEADQKASALLALVA